jgi:hypothetical protein
MFARWAKFEGEFPSLAARKFSIFFNKQQRKSLIKLFKVCGFSRQSLESRSAERETLSALQAGGAPADRLEGVKSPLVGDFTPSLSARNSGGFLILSALSRVARMVVAYGEWLSASRNGYLPTAK